MNKYIFLLIILFSIKSYANKECRETIKINKTQFAWNNFDEQSMETAKKRCPAITKGRSPCLKYFIKKTKQDYNAICSGFWFKNNVK